jgi:hypothetical protein
VNENEKQRRKTAPVLLHKLGREKCLKKAPQVLVFITKTKPSLPANSERKSSSRGYVALLHHSSRKTPKQVLNYAQTDNIDNIDIIVNLGYVSQANSSK